MPFGLFLAKEVAIMIKMREEDIRVLGKYLNIGRRIGYGPRYFNQKDIDKLKQLKEGELYG
jgi:hypothetical protein